MRAMRCMDVVFVGAASSRETIRIDRGQMPLPREMMCDIEKTFCYDV
jgi:hypothetical protein